MIIILNTVIFSLTFGLETGLEERKLESQTW